MRDARRATCLCGLALLLSGTLSAQTYPNGLSADSVDPRTDAVVIREIRQRLDQVRRTQKRPTVGVVLSGGGAKGAAEVGALKYIEELGIPVDFVCGTSIGGLVGGFYALGYRAADLEKLFRSQDWSVMLTDRVAPEFIPYTTKVNDATYLIGFPFHYPKDREDKIPYRLRDRVRNEIGERSGRNSGRAGMAAFASSLPSGYAYGFNVNNLLSSMSVGYQDSISFSKLPLPYVCVAGDMVSSKAKNWGSGSITTAMRSTMSIPGLFEPVRSGKMVLVDGGVRNNFPADIARAVGVDYLIGIELSDARPESSADINNIGDILGQFITMLGTDSFNKNISKTDVFIKPELGEFNMLSFNAAAVDSMLLRGYNAAVAQREGLLAIREKTGEVHGGPNARAVNLGRRPVYLRSIEYDGISDADSKRVSRITGLDIRQPIDKKTIDEAMSRLQASGAFETVTYSLYGSEEPYRLVFHCSPAPIHGFGVSLRADSIEGASLLLGVGLNTNRLSGSKVDFRIRLGQTIKVAAHYALDLSDLPTLNFTASLSRYRGHLGSFDDEIKYDISYLTHREDFFVSGLNWTRMDIRAGFAHKAYHLSPNTPFARTVQSLGIPLNTNYLGTYLQGSYYTYDNYYFPTRGVSLRLRADYDFVRLGTSDFTPVLTAAVDFGMAVPLGEKWELLPDLHLRAISHFGEEVVDGLFHTNFVGSVLPGRFAEDQVPFFGVNTLLATGDYLIDLVAKVRWNPLKNLYVSAQGGVLIHDNSIGAMFRNFGPDVWAVGLEGAYDTLLGPIKLDIHWSNVHKWGAYISLGFDF